MSKKLILVVDDDITTTRLLKIGLEGTGAYRVREENIATRAVATARECQPDLVVLDVCMPNADGGDVAAQIQDDPRLRNTPVIFLTSIVSEAEAGQQSLHSGGYQFIAKPVQIQKLVRCIESKLSSPTQAACR
jgi:CheY-like chemotaxis protein